MTTVAPEETLSPYAASLLRVLTVPGAEENPVAREPLDASRLSDLELGMLYPAALRLPPQHPAAGTRSDITWAVRQRQPVFTPDSCVAMLSTLADVAERDGYFGADPVLAVKVLLRCEGPWPQQAAQAARKLVKHRAAHGRREHPYALLTLIEFAGLTGAVVTRLLTWSPNPIAAEEIQLLKTLGPAVQALVAEIRESPSYHSPPQLPDVWQRLADVPEYPPFAHQALRAAHDRVADIQSGKRAYQADAAFGKDEVEVLGAALRVALLRDEPWLMDLLRPLLLGVAVAPTDAKTAPSQALLFEVARAVEDFPTPEALAALRDARAAARHKGIHRQLDRKLQRIARALGNRPDVAYRMRDLGFGPDGVRVVRVGDHQAVLTVSHDVELSWHRPDGKLSAAVPAPVRRDHPDQVKEVRGLVKQARNQLVTLAQSLEARFSGDTTLPYGRWRELAADGLGRSVVRRLIWEVPDPDGQWRVVLPTDGGLVDLAGTEMTEPSPDTPVRLWHPLDSSPEEILALRDRLVDRELRQPFKQAFREVYLLTPAEEETATYSNRFAAHIVRYKQLYALMKARGWTCRMLGPWDSGDGDDAYRVLGGGAWRVSFSHHYRDSDDGAEYAATDRLWFDRRVGGAWRQAPLAEVPTIVLSEAMRDVDLFVSVTSIAADPAWMDNGDERYADYWRNASFGDLTGTALVRRSALERIIPRTKIADRCELTDRYLVVHGQLNTYKIHLGSGNILMEPGNTYLCIVPSRRQSSDAVFLPFEEDRLALILSKAFLLADDATITDASIVAQLHRGR